MTRVTYGTQSNEEKVWYGFNIETEKNQCWENL